MIPEQVSFSGNQTIPLDREAPPRLLLAGSAAVFAVDRETGERFHLFSIEPGEPVLPIDSPADGPLEPDRDFARAVRARIGRDEPEWKTIFALENWLPKWARRLPISIRRRTFSSLHRAP